MQIKTAFTGEDVMPGGFGMVCLTCYFMLLKCMNRMPYLMASFTVHLANLGIRHGCIPKCRELQSTNL